MEMNLPGKRMTAGICKPNERSAHQSTKHFLRMYAPKSYSIEMALKELQDTEMRRKYVLGQSLPFQTGSFIGWQEFHCGEERVRVATEVRGNSMITKLYARKIMYSLELGIKHSKFPVNRPLPSFSDFCQDSGFRVRVFMYNSQP